MGIATGIFFEVGRCGTWGHEMQESSLPCGDEVALSDSVKRHLAFNRILELWQENCTCGEYRTVRLNAGLCDGQCVKKTFGVMTNR